MCSRPHCDRQPPQSVSTPATHPRVKLTSGNQCYPSLLTAAALRVPFQSFSTGVVRAIVGRSGRKGRPPGQGRVWEVCGRKGHLRVGPGGGLAAETVRMDVTRRGMCQHAEVSVRVEAFTVHHSLRMPCSKKRPVMSASVDSAATCAALVEPRGGA
jgi:hypothetical protein